MAYIVGTSADDDALYGLPGDDVIDGRGGADVMVGGTGNDVYYIDNPQDQVIETTGQGIDKLLSTVNYTLAAGQEVEYLRTGGRSRTTGIILTGNELDNHIAGGSFTDTLNGGGGDDHLDGLGSADVPGGGTGNDVYYVGDSGDQVIETAGQGIDTISTSVNYTLAAGEEVEYLRSRSEAWGTFSLTLTGNELDNHIVGNSGDDTLNGGGGDDYIDGHGGADILAGGTGNDHYYVTDSYDLVIEAAGQGIDKVFTTVNYTLTAGQEIEYLRVDHTLWYGTVGLTLTGNELDNYIIGCRGIDTLNGGGGDDRLNGWPGADVMVGGTGNDIYYIDDPGDQVTETAGQGIDTISSYVNYTLAAGEEVEYLRARSYDPWIPRSLTLTGNELDNHIVGNSGNDTLNGGGGDDHIDGHGGTDILAGGTGNDVYYVGDSDDQVTETTGQGIDKICTTANYTLAAGQEVEYLRVYGTAGLILTGNGLANDIAGNAGIDTLNGGGGDDRLNGGLSNDQLTGGSGNDIFTFGTAIAGGDNIDLVADFTPGSDTIQLNATNVFAGLAVGQLTAAQFTTGSATGTGPQIVYDQSTGALFYDSNGADAGGAFQFARLTGSPSLTSADFTVV